MELHEQWPNEAILSVCYHYPDATDVPRIMLSSIHTNFCSQHKCHNLLINLNSLNVSVENNII